MIRVLWNTNPLWLVGLVLVGQVLAFTAGYLDPSIVGTAMPVMGLAYLQNTTYGLQSRSANRNSNAYHALAAVAANFTFFWSLQLLVRNELPLALLAPYVFATILGTLHGNALSMKIERWLNIDSLLGPAVPKGQKASATLWPLVGILTVALVTQAAFLETGIAQGMLIALLVLTVVGSFSFSLFAWKRSAVQP